MEHKEDDDELIPSAKILRKIMGVIEAHNITKEYAKKHFEGLQGYDVLTSILNREVCLESRNQQLNYFAQKVGLGELQVVLRWLTKHYKPKE